MSTEWTAIPTRVYEALLSWHDPETNSASASADLRDAVDDMLAASPQPAAQPSRCGLTECQGKPMCPRCERWNARAIEREVLATRKLSDEQVARIMGAADKYAKIYLQRGSFGSQIARAEVERLLRGEA